MDGQSIRVCATYNTSIGYIVKYEIINIQDSSRQDG